MMKLQSPCLCSVTSLLLCRATSGKPILVNSERNSSMSGAVYSTNSNPSVPIGLANPVTVFSSTVVAMLDSFAAQLLLSLRHVKGGEDGRSRWMDSGGGRQGTGPDLEVQGFQRGLRIPDPRRSVRREG